MQIAAVICMIMMSMHTLPHPKFLDPDSNAAARAPAGAMI